MLSNFTQIQLGGGSRPHQRLNCLSTAGHFLSADEGMDADASALGSQLACWPTPATVQRRRMLAGELSTQAGTRRQHHYLRSAGSTFHPAFREPLGHAGAEQDVTPAVNSRSLRMISPPRAQKSSVRADRLAHSPRLARRTIARSVRRRRPRPPAGYRPPWVTAHPPAQRCRWPGAG